MSAISIPTLAEKGSPYNVSETDALFQGIEAAINDNDSRIDTLIADVASLQDDLFVSTGGSVAGAVNFEQAVDFDVAPTIPASTLDTHPMRRDQAIALFASTIRRVNCVAVDTTNSTPSTAYYNGQTIGGVVVATGDTVLRAYQNSANNGPYTVGATSGTGARTTGYTTWADMVGLVAFVSAGGSWGSSASGSGTLGSTALTFTNTDAPAVGLTGDQTITGTKTMTGATLLVADPGASDTSARAVPMSRLQTALGGKLSILTTGTPSGGADGDYVMTLAAPYANQVWKKTSGVWGIWGQFSTFESLPSASSCPNAEYLVTTINSLDVYQVAHSDGTRWRPNEGFWRIAYGQRTSFTGTTTETALRTIRLPVGLVQIGDEIRVKGETRKNVTSAGTITLRFKVYDGASSDANLAAFTQATDRAHSRLECVMTRQSGTTHYTLTQGDNDDGFGNSSVGDQITVNFASPIDVQQMVQMANSGDDITSIAFWVEVHTPYLN